MSAIKDLRLAVLIDADNVSHAHVREMFEEISKYGTPTFKRIYADWTKVHASGWKNVLLEYAIAPIQQYSYSVGKNSTDSAMIIDAMDILYSEKVDGFCIVSSDSDFTKLAMRLRESGMTVFGLGEKKTPKPFITACDKFIYLEILKETEQRRGRKFKKAVPKSTENKSEIISKQKEELTKMIRESIFDVEDEDGWAYIGELMKILMKRKPDFDTRSYGYDRLLPLIKSLKIFEIQSRETSRKEVKHIYVRVKE
jgi:uncharacterized LabA/DUF88 family protein